MVQTVENYLRTNYGMSPIPSLRELLDAYGIRMNTLADARAEFACDCLWDACRDVNSFLETAIRQSVLSDKDSYRVMAERFAGRVISRVRGVWDSRGPSHVDLMETSVKSLVTDYLVRYAIPCGNPWDTVMACQVDTDLEFIVRRAAEYAKHHDENACRHEYETTAHPESCAVFASGEASWRLKRDWVRSAYDVLLRKTYGLL